jgi:hypothetical protein
MGRFKRHQRKYKTNVVHTPNGDMIVSVTDYEPIPRGKNTPRTLNVFRNLFLSLKRRNMFGKFINDYAPIEGLLYATDEGNAIESATNQRNMDSGIYMSKVKLHSPIYVYSYYELFNTIYGRANLLKGLLYRRRRNVPSDAIPMGIGEVIEPYMIDELKKRGKKVYPNDLVFGFLFGTIFTIIGFAVTIFFLWRLFSPTVVIIVCGVVMILLLLFKLSLNIDNID